MPTHMDQYLQLDSHHHIGEKYSIIKTLNHRDKTVSSTVQHFRTEVNTSRKY